MTTPIVFLIDNGSLRPQATFGLRDLAVKLSELSGHCVEGVSLLHSHKIDPDKLNGIPATIVKRRLRELLAEGHREFVFLPLFLGPSLAIVDYLPEVIEEERLKFQNLDVKIAEPLVGESIDCPDLRLAQILADHVRALKPDASAKVALIDHGTPVETVNRVRNAVAVQLSELLHGQVDSVRACSMERRAGAAYEFNEPLLEGLGNEANFAGGHLILAMFFLLPGRHAGEGGDVADIYQKLIDSGAFNQIETTALMAEHPILLEILRDRLAEALSGRG